MMMITKGNDDGDNDEDKVFINVSIYLVYIIKCKLIVDVHLSPLTEIWLFENGIQYIDCLLA